jgi:hypothetical protein
MTVIHQAAGRVQLLRIGVVDQFGKLDEETVRRQTIP